MIIFLVGGSLRDRILGLKIVDNDWVIVGGIKNFLIKYKFFQVGKNFPIFIHPITKEEYSLARVEKKYYYGYKNFYINFNFFVTIEEDLYRRDLSINSIAKNFFGYFIIDPYNGINDVKIRILRHVSLFFIEDPIRILRIARFSAKFYNYSFFVAYETLDLIKYIVNTLEISVLPAERVWKEFIKVFNYGNLDYFFSILYKCEGIFIIKPLLSIFLYIPFFKNSICLKNYIYFYMNLFCLIFYNFNYRMIVFYYKIINLFLKNKFLFLFFKYKFFCNLFINIFFSYYKLSNNYFYLINNLYFLNIFLLNFFYFDSRIVFKILTFLDFFRRSRFCKKFLLLVLIKLDIFFCNFINVLILYDIMSFINKKCFFLNYNFFIYKKVKYFNYKKKLSLLDNYLFF